MNSRSSWRLKGVSLALITMAWILENTPQLENSEAGRVEGGEYDFLGFFLYSAGLVLLVADLVMIVSTYKLRTLKSAMFWVSLLFAGIYLFPIEQEAYDTYCRPISVYTINLEFRMPVAQAPTTLEIGAIYKTGRNTTPVRGERSADGNYMTYHTSERIWGNSGVVTVQFTPNKGRLWASKFELHDPAENTQFSPWQSANGLYDSVSYVPLTALPGDPARILPNIEMRYFVSDFKVRHGY